ncbi:MAG: DUF1016 N-terminal domain-containing protein [Chitinophagales bacterium]
MIGHQIIEQAQKDAYKSINVVMLQTYWSIGKLIVAEEQKNESKKNSFVSEMLPKLSVKLPGKLGKSFSETNLQLHPQMFCAD